MRIKNKKQKYRLIESINNAVGAYQITGKGSEANNMKFLFVKKPNLVNRFFCRILLGWVWIDEM
tara:strand:+ start:164 stop:355 length:192 start_codon:yes stop_codon:yes gene_type:complete